MSAINERAWQIAGDLRPPPPGAILVFAYWAYAGHEPTSLEDFDKFQKHVFDVAGKVGIDACLIAGYIQSHGHFASLTELDEYLNQIGVRDPNTKDLINPHYCPGPGDGWVFNDCSPGSTDPCQVRGVPQGARDAAAGLSRVGMHDLGAELTHVTADPVGWVRAHPLMAGAVALGAYLVLRR